MYVFQEIPKAHDKFNNKNWNIWFSTDTEIHHVIILKYWYLHT